MAGSQPSFSRSRAGRFRGLTRPDDSITRRCPSSIQCVVMNRSCVRRSLAGSSVDTCRRDRSLGIEVLYCNITSPPLSGRDCQVPLSLYFPPVRVFGPAHSHFFFTRRHASTLPSPYRCHANMRPDTSVLPLLAAATSACRSTKPNNG